MKHEKAKGSQTPSFLKEVFEGNNAAAMRFQLILVNRMTIFVKGFKQSKVGDFRDTEKGFDGMWGYYRIPGGGGFKAVDSQEVVEVVVNSNYFSDSMSLFDACIGCNLYAFSYMSFSSDEVEGRLMSKRFHQLRSYVLENLPEDRAVKLLQMID